MADPLVKNGGAPGLEGGKPDRSRTNNPIHLHSERRQQSVSRCTKWFGTTIRMALLKLPIASSEMSARRSSVRSWSTGEVSLSNTSLCSWNRCKTRRKYRYWRHLPGSARCVANSLHSMRFRLTFFNALETTRGFPKNTSKVSPERMR
jgi:hypothetical protein